MNLQKTNQQSVIEQAKAASEGFATQLAQICGKLSDGSEHLKENTVTLANLTREAGMVLSAWMDREQMRFEQFEGFFRQHSAELPTWLNSSAGRKLISAYKAYPEEITDLKVAVNILNQMTFFAVGLMDEPQRLLQQTASGVGPLEKCVSIWSKEREAIEKLKAQIPMIRWTPEIWFSVKSHCKESADLYAMAVEKLK